MTPAPHFMQNAFCFACELSQAAALAWLGRNLLYIMTVQGAARSRLTTVIGSLTIIAACVGQ